MDFLATLGLVTFLLMAGQYSILVITAAGQAHFVHAYWRMGKAGKLTLRRLGPPALFVAALLLVFLWRPFPDLLIFGVATYFVLHMYFDERHLRGESDEQRSLLELLSFLIIIASAMMMKTFELPPVVLRVSVVLSVGLMLIVLWRRWRGRHRITRTGFLFLAWSAIAVGGYLAEWDFLIHNLWGLVVPFHYVHWYLAYGMKLRRYGRPIRGYLLEILLFLLPSAFFGYLYHVEGWRGDVLTGLYRLDYFNFWTLLHLLATNRGEDWYQLQPWRSRNGTRPIPIREG